MCFVINLVYEILKLSYGISGDTYRLLVFRYIFLISIGCYIYSGKSLPKKWVGIISCLTGAIWLVMYQYMGYKPKIITYWAGTCMIAALWIIPIIWALIKNETLSKLSCKPLEALGKASYNIFLTQMIFYVSVAGNIYQFTYNRIAQLICCILFNVVTGYLFYKIESKITKVILNYIKRKNYWTEKIKRLICYLQQNMMD